MVRDDYEFITKLVKEVEKHKCLYDNTMTENRNRYLIQATWDKVAEEIDSTAKICKETWARLRVGYNRCFKKPLSASTTTKKQDFLLHNMHFLKKFMNCKKTLRKKLSSPPQKKKGNALSKPTDLEDKNQNVEDNKAHSSNAPNLTVENINSSFSTTPQYSSTDPPPKKNNAQNTYAESSESKSEDRESPKQKFLLSLLPDFEEMDANQLRMFKLKIIELTMSVLSRQETIPKSSEKLPSLAKPLVSPQQKSQIPGEASSMTRPLVSPQPISQSSNKVSSMPKPTTSSSTALHQQSDPWIYIDEDTDDEDIMTRASNGKVEPSC